MALNLSVFPRLQMRQGQFPPVLPLSPMGEAGGTGVVSSVVASGARSAAIPAGSLIRLITDEDMRLAWSTDPNMAGPAVDALKLVYAQEYRFELPEGPNPFYVRVVAG